MSRAVLIQCYVQCLVWVLLSFQSVLCAGCRQCYVQCLVWALLSFQSVLCAGCSQCYVQCLVFVMCSYQSVLSAVFSLLCAVFSSRDVEFAVMSLVAPLRAYLASLGRAYACMHMFEAGQNERWCADSLGRTSVEAPDVYIYICSYQRIYDA